MNIIAKLAALPFALALANPLSALAQSLPTGGNVVGGSASIGQTGNTMTIDQTTNRAAINWTTFNIGVGNTVQFVQPNSNSITLNRVVGGVPSNIQGALLANGQVWIQNANGVLFGSGATINVNSLLVTTKNIDVNQFMSGSNTFDLTSTGINAGIINDGTITAAGYVTLVGDQVRNTGTINAKQVTLAAGDSATLALDNGQGISVTLTNSTANALVENSGKIVAGNNGSVLLTAQGKDTLLNTVINLSGVVKAGTIVADAGITGDVVVTGDLDASNQNGKGGTVVLSGNRVGLFDDATVNVSGDAGGGLAIIGGDKLGKVPGSSATNLINEVAFADYTQIDSGVKIDAGSTNGDGGFVETSAAVLSVDGTISAAAPNGKAGLWLIDPTDLTISTAATNANTDTSVLNTFKPVAAPTGVSVVNNGSIETALGGANVLITTLGSAATGTQAGNISLAPNTNITTASGNPYNLTLEAAGNVIINGNISLGGGSLNLTADADATGDGTVLQSVGTTIDLHDGTLTVSGNTSALTTEMGVDIRGSLLNIGGGTITGSANSAAGVFFEATSTLSTTDDLTITGNTNQSQTGAAIGVTLGGAITTAGNKLTVLSDGTIRITGNIATAGGDLTLTADTDGSGTGGVNQAVNSSTIDLAGGNLTASGNTENAGTIGAVLFYGNLNVGSATLTGVANGGPGVSLSTGAGSVTNITGDDSVITGSSNTGRGVVIALGNGSSVHFGGTNTAINGTSNSCFGAAVYGEVTTNSGVTLSIEGSSNSGPGVNILASANLSADGAGTVVTVNGTSNTGVGVVVNGSASGDNGGVLNIGGKSTNGTGVSIGATGTVSSNGTDASGNPTQVTVNGTSTNGDGIAVNGSANGDNGGVLNLGGTSTNGTGVNIGSSGNVSSNGTDASGNPTNVTVTGNSTNGDGVAINGNAGTTNGGELTINGTAATNGTGVNIGSGGNVTADGNGSVTNVTGISDNGSGVENEGTIKGTDNGTVNVVGLSTNGTGVDNQNGTIIADGNGTEVTVNGTSTNGTAGVDNTNGTMTEVNGGDITVFSSPAMIGNPVMNASVSSGSSGSGGHGGGGGGGSNSVAIGGGILIAGLIGYAIYDHKAAASDSPQAMTEEDGKVAEATLDEVSVNAEGTEAVVKVRTASGVAERKLALKDSGDGVRHFALNDAGVSTELSFNPQTREYFYRESGAAKNLKAHGWLKEVVASR